MFKKANSYFKGIFFEICAIIYLSLKLYVILQWRYKTKVGEIDLVTLKKDLVIFIEIKYCSNTNYIFDLVSKKQQDRIKKAASLFITNNHYCNNVRFDLIIFRNIFNINHIKNAF